MRTNEIKKWEEKVKRKNLKYKTNKYVYGFEQVKTIKSFGDRIYTGKIIIDESEIDQSNLLENMVEFHNKSKPKTKEVRMKNEILLIA